MKTTEINFSEREKFVLKRAMFEDWSRATKILSATEDLKEKEFWLKEVIKRNKLLKKLERRWFK